MRLQTIANYWVRNSLGDYPLARKCARYQADEEGLRFTQKEINAALRRAFNRLPDQERDELYPYVDRPDLRPQVDADADDGTGFSICHQAENQDQVQDERGRLTGTGRAGAGGEERPETYDLRRRDQSGQLMPVSVRLGSMPPSASEAMRRVGEDIALLIGLRLAVDEDRPLLYSTSF